jgi:hypothetical protein
VPSLALAVAPAPVGCQDGRWRAGVSSFSFLPPFLTGKGEDNAKKVEKLKEELLAAIGPLERGAEATPEDKERVEQVRSSTSLLPLTVVRVTVSARPLNSKRVAVKFDYFKMFSLVRHFNIQPIDQMLVSY